MAASNRSGAPDSVGVPETPAKRASIIGRGLLASAFQLHHDRIPENVVICAAGVPNSMETDKAAFQRERRQLQALVESIGHRRLAYFSSISIHDEEAKGRPYVMHKLAMEEIVESAPNHAIFRLAHVVGSGANPKTITEYIYRCMRSGERFKVWLRAYRSLIDVEDVVRIVNYFLAHEQTDTIRCDVAANWLPVTEIVALLEEVTGLKANYEPVDKGSQPPSVGNQRLSPALEALGIRFNEKYTESILRKYYGRGAS